MTVNTENLVSITEANQNFSRVARMVDKNGAVVILKNNTPRYVLIEFDKLSDDRRADDDMLAEVSRRIMKQNKEAYEVLAK